MMLRGDVAQRLEALLPELAIHVKHGDYLGAKIAYHALREGDFEKARLVSQIMLRWVTHPHMARYPEGYARNLVHGVGLMLSQIETENSQAIPGIDWYPRSSF